MPRFPVPRSRRAFPAAWVAAFPAAWVAAFVAAAFVAAVPAPPVRAQTAKPARSSPARLSKNQQEAALIRTFLKRKYPASPGSVVRGVEGNWAIADLLAPPDRDPAFVLLRKKGGKWTEATMGTSLYGAGKQLGVPKRLWKKWDL